MEVWTSPISKHTGDPQLVIWEMNTHTHRLLIPQGLKPLVSKFFYISNIWLNYLQTRPVLSGSTIASPQRHQSAITCQKYDTRDKEWQAATSGTTQKRRLDRAHSVMIFQVL